MTEQVLKRIDWLLVFFVLPITLAGLFTMKSFTPEDASTFFGRQATWILVSFLVFFALSFIDFRFLKRTDVLVFIFTCSCVVLISLLAIGHVSHGAKSWFSFGGFSFQPVDVVKLVLILILAKTFSRRL